MNTRLIRGIVLFLLGTCLFAAAEAKEFVVGTTSAYAPFVSLDEKGEYVGFDIDIAKELSKRLDCDLVIKDLGSMPSLFLALKQGKIDAIIWAVSITEERQKQVEMIYYQGENVTSLPLLFWKEIPQNVSCIEDLTKNPQAVVCTEAGSFQEGFLQSVPGLKLKQVDKVMDALLELKYGKSIATMIDPSLVPNAMKQFPELKIMEVPLPFSKQSFGFGICVSKKNTALAGDVRRAIAALREEGFISALEAKWNLTGK